MKLRNLIEIELGKDPEHEKIIKGREETLLDKIKRKQAEKKTTLKDYENKARYDTERTAVGLKELGKELQNFNEFVEKKIKEYIADKKMMSLPGSDTLIGVMTNLFLQRSSIEISKNKQKMIIDLIKTGRDEKIFDSNSKENIKAIKRIVEIMLLTPEPELHQQFRDVVGKDFVDLDIEDIEEFINNLSKDKEIKAKIAKINNSLTRLSDLLATTKHLSQVGSGKKVINLPQRK